MSTIHNDVWDDFEKIYDHFPIDDFPIFSKIVQRPGERFQTLSEDFRTSPEDCRRRPKKIERCFDHTLTNVGAVKKTKTDHFSKMISSHVPKVWNGRRILRVFTIQLTCCECLIILIAFSNLSVCFKRRYWAAVGLFTVQTMCSQYSTKL